MNHSLYCVAFGLSQTCVPPRAPRACICEDWVGIFIFLKHLLFCSASVPPGTAVLIFLEGMFREPRSPRGKDNGGCDVTSILGASGGGKGKKSWVALMSSGTSFLKEFYSFSSTLQEEEEDLKWLPRACTCTRCAHLRTSAPRAPCPQAKLTVCKKKKKKAGFLPETFPPEFQDKRRNTCIGEALKWLPTKYKGSSAPAEL